MAPWDRDDRRHEGYGEGRFTTRPSRIDEAQGYTGRAGGEPPPGGSVGPYREGGHGSLYNDRPGRVGASGGYRGDAGVDHREEHLRGPWGRGGPGEASSPGGSPLDDERRQYLAWRDRQLEQCDRDYGEYCKLRQNQLASEFERWRAQRRAQGDASV